MKLYLVQHGEACAKDVDPNRPLTEKGRADVERIAQFLQRPEISVDRVIHSGKLRAAQTAEIILDKLSPGLETEVSSSINPNNDPAAFDWQSTNKSTNNSHDTLIVGHLPFMAKFVSYLLTGDGEKIIAAYQPGSIVCLERAENNFWQLNWMIRPELTE